MIDARTQLVGLMGWPVEHSVSPAMHNAAFGALGLNWCYVCLPVSRIGAAVHGLGALGFRGANVTAPYKEAVLPHLDGLSDAARAIRAANTILVQTDPLRRLVGHNTDADGFMAAIRDAEVELSGRRAVVVGAGGAARAVVYSLIRAGVGEIVLLSRSPRRAQGLVSVLRGFSGASHRLEVQALSEKVLIHWARSCDLLINATSVGQWPQVDESIWPEGMPMPAHLVVFDLVYNPLETRLVRQARESGALAVGGLEMLVRQGALALELWTGQPPPLAVMRAAAQQAVQRQGGHEGRPYRGGDHVAFSDRG